MSINSVFFQVTKRFVLVKLDFQLLDKKLNFLEMKINDFHMKNHLQDQKKMQAILLSKQNLTGKNLISFNKTVKFGYCLELRMLVFFWLSDLQSSSSWRCLQVELSLHYIAKANLSTLHIYFLDGKGSVLYSWKYLLAFICLFANSTISKTRSPLI